VSTLIDQCRVCDRFVEAGGLDDGRCADCAEKAAHDYPIGEAYERGWHDGHTVGYRQGRRAKGRRGPAMPAAGIEPGLLRDLIRLCHPDMHPAERAGLANRVTQILLAARDRGEAHVIHRNGEEHR
jgi:hypothetical protein